MWIGCRLTVFIDLVMLKRDNAVVLIHLLRLDFDRAWEVSQSRRSVCELRATAVDVQRSEFIL